MRPAVDHNRVELRERLVGREDLTPGVVHGRPSYPLLTHWRAIIGLRARIEDVVPHKSHCQLTVARLPFVFERVGRDRRCAKD